MVVFNYLLVYDDDKMTIRMRHWYTGLFVS